MKKKIIISSIIIGLILLVVGIGSFLFYKKNGKVINMASMATKQLIENMASSSSPIYVWKKTDTEWRPYANFLTDNLSIGTFVNPRGSGSDYIEPENSKYGACLGHHTSSTTKSTAYHVIQCIDYSVKTSANKEYISYSGLDVSSSANEDTVAYELLYLIASIKEGNFGTTTNGKTYNYTGKSKSVFSYIVYKNLEKKEKVDERIYTLYTDKITIKSDNSYLKAAQNFTNKLKAYKSKPIAVTINGEAETKNNYTYIPVKITNNGNDGIGVSITEGTGTIKGYTTEKDSTTFTSFTKLKNCTDKEIFVVVYKADGNLKIKFSNYFDAYTGRIILLGVENGQNIAIFNSTEKRLTSTVSISISTITSKDIYIFKQYEGKLIKEGGCVFDVDMGDGTSKTVITAFSGSNYLGKVNLSNSETTITIKEVGMRWLYGFNGTAGNSGTVTLNSKGKVSSFSKGTITEVDEKDDGIYIYFNNTPQLGDLKITKVNDSNEYLSDVYMKLSITGYFEDSWEKDEDSPQTSTRYIQIIDSNGEPLTDIKKAISINKNNIASSTEYAIKYVKNASEATVFKTDSSGVIQINNLEVYYPTESVPKNKNYTYYKGKSKYVYQAIEIKNSNYGYKSSDGTTSATKTLTTGKTVDSVILNPQYLGNLGIVKQDESSGNNLAGVEMKIQVFVSSQTTKYQYIEILDENNEKVDPYTNTITNGTTDALIINEKNKTKTNYHIKLVDDIDQATTFITNANGKILINNLEIYANKTQKYLYQAVEINNPNYGYGYYKNNASKALSAAISLTVNENDDEENEDVLLGDYNYTAADEESDDIEKITKDADVITFTNTPYYANLKIIKTDSRDKSLVEDVEYTLFDYNIQKYVQLINEKGKVVENVKGTVTISKTGKYTSTDGVQYGYATTNDETKATRFITDANGQVIVNNLERYYSYSKTKTGDITIPKTFVVHEIKADDWHDLPASNGYGEGKALSSENNTISFTNTPNFLVVSGIVWEDGLKSGKEDTYNDLYNSSDTLDKLLGGIVVKVMDENGTKLRETKTDSNGKYSIRVKYEEIEKKGAYIEFEYNGITYTSVALNKNEDKGSKAAEYSASRTTLNNNFSSVVGKGTGNGNKVNVNGKDVTYNSDYSTTYGELNTTVVANTSSNCVGTNLLNAILTQKVNEDKDKNKVNVSSIENINLGLRTREQADLAINSNTDIQKVEVSVNGYTHTYDYGNRQENYNTQNVKKLNTTVKAGSIFNQNSYTRTLSETDIAEALDNNNNAKVEVYVTYAISIQNDTTTLKEKVNNLRFYIDSNYDVNNAKVYVIENEKEESIEIGEAKPIKNSRYSYIEIKAGEYLTVDATKAKTIYVKVPVSNGVYNNIINKEDVELNSVAEIYSYTTYYGSNTYEAGKEGARKGQLYASVDKDSIAGNVYLAETSKTQEDDTNVLPGFKLTVENARALAGTVWEDDTTYDATNENGRLENGRLGDGILDSDENKVANVKVELLEVDENGNIKTDSSGNAVIATLYNYENKKTVESKAVTYTDTDGKYTFTGVATGKYVVRFTYGTTTDSAGNTITTEINGTAVDAREYKSTILKEGSKVYTIIQKGKENLNWYLEESTKYSDAVDNTTQRADLDDDELNNSNYGTGTMMYADTPTMEVGIEFLPTNESHSTSDGLSYVKDANGKTVNIVDYIITQDNIDFGIAQRAKINAEVSKKITYIKGTLQSGQVLFEGNPSEQTVTISYVKSGLAGMVPIEIDTELLQGLTLEATYTISIANTSEIDYDYNSDDWYYYYFGEIKDGATTTSINITKLVDYLEDNVTVAEKMVEDGTWQETSAKKLYREKYINDTVDNEAIDKKYIVLETDKIGKIGNGQTASVELKVSKLLSATTEFTEYNHTEILAIQGRLISDATPGNYDPTTFNVHQVDDDNVKMTVTPPTGGTEVTSENYVNFVEYAIIGTVVVLIGITFVIVIVKKKKRID
jgi:hypothetical protein